MLLEGHAEPKAVKGINLRKVVPQIDSQSRCFGSAGYGSAEAFHAQLVHDQGWWLGRQPSG